MGGLIPPSTTDRLVFSIFLLGGHLYLWYELKCVIPSYHQDYNTTVYLHCAIAAWTYFQIIANIFLMRFTESSGEQSLREAKRKDFWRFCEKCRESFPPRSHHCKLCGECVLRRDHHCWFAGCCVSAANQRYYIVAISYICFAALYGNIINLSYVGETLGGFGPWTLFSLLAPHVVVLTGALSPFQFFVTLMTTIAYLVNILTLWLLQIMYVQIVNGQTKHERSKKLVERYDLGMPANLHAVLGYRWYLVWVWPWVRSTPTDDGMSYGNKLNDKTE